MRRSVLLSLPLLLALGACGRVSFKPLDAGIDAQLEELDARGADDADDDARAPSDAGRDTPLPPDAGRDAPPVDAFTPPDAAIDARIDAALDGGPCVPSTLRPDRDRDGFGDPRQATFGCPIPGYVVDGTDCDDTSADSHPGAVEICNCHDDDCNGMVDELASCRSASHVVWARSYGGPSSDAPWQMASDGTTLHLCGQSWEGGFEILPGERTRSTANFQAAFDARTGLGIWGNADPCSAVGVRAGRLWTYLEGARLEVGDERRTVVSWRHTPSGVGAYGGAFARLALASGTGTVFLVGGYRAPADLGLGPLPDRGPNDVVLYALDVGGTLLWQRAVGSSGDDGERGVTTTPTGNRVAISVNAPGPIDMGGGELPGSDPFVIGVYDGSGNHVYSTRSPDIELGLAMASDGTLFVGRFSEIEVYDAAGMLRPPRPTPPGALLVGLAAASSGDLHVSYLFTGPIAVGGTPYTPTDAEDGLVVVYDSAGRVRWAQQLDVAPTSLFVGPAGETYAIGTVLVDDPVDECGGVAAIGGGGGGDGDMLLMMLR